jgi:hypothetical protein
MHCVCTFLYTRPFVSTFWKVLLDILICGNFLGAVVLAQGAIIHSKFQGPLGV